MRRVMPGGTQTRSSAIGGRSTPQVLLSLHFKTQRKLLIMTALEPPMVTLKVLVVGMLGLAPTVQAIELLVEFATAQATPSMRMVAGAKPKLLPDMVIVYPPKMSPQGGTTDCTMGVWSLLNSIALLNVLVLAPSLQVTADLVEERVAVLLLMGMPKSWISARLHCESLVCLNLKYLQGVVSLETRTFHPLWTVWSRVPSSCQVESSFEPSKTPPKMLLAVLSQPQQGKNLNLLTEACRPCPTSISMQQTALDEPQTVLMSLSNAAVTLVMLAALSLLYTKVLLSICATFARLNQFCELEVMKGGTLQVTAVEVQVLTVPLKPLTVIQLEGERLFPVMVKTPPAKELMMEAAVTEAGRPTLMGLLTLQYPQSVRARMLYDPELSVVVKEQEVVEELVKLLIVMMLVASTAETSLRLVMGSPVVSLRVKVTVLAPGVKVVLGAMMLGVMALLVVQVVEQLLTGPLKVIVMVFVGGEGGRARVSTLLVQHEITLTAALLPPISTKILNPLPRTEGQPEPIEKVTMLPMTEPPPLYEGIPATQFTLSARPLLSPMSFLTLTKQLPDGTVAGTLNTALVLVQVAVVAKTSELLAWLVRLTPQAPLRMLVPLRVMLMDPAEEADILVRVGLEAAGLQVNPQLLPGQVLREYSLVETTTFCSSEMLQCLTSKAGVLQVICVAVMVQILQNQFKVSPTQTRVSEQAGEKLFPVMVMRVPPQQLPEVGEMEVMLHRYQNWSTPGLAMESPTELGRVTWTVNTPGRPPERPTVMYVS